MKARLTKHYLAVLVLAPFVAALGDFQANLYDYHGLSGIFSHILSDTVLAAVFVIPLAVYYAPVAVLYHLVLRRAGRVSRRAVFLCSLSVLAIFPAIAVLFAYAGHYVSSYALVGGVFGASVLCPILISIWLPSKTTEPNQALQHNDPSCHVSCLRTPRASRGRG